MALEEAGVKLIAEGAAAFAGDMKTATQATDTFVDTTEKGGGIVERAGGMMGSAIKNVAAIAAGVGVAGFVALGKAVYDGIGAARESAKLNASTEATILSMGNAAGRSVEQITAMASALSDASGKSLFGDDQIQQSQNLLLTFGNIKGETFDLATALTVDLAQALGGAPADQAMMLGKALQDPVKGITALGKAGLTFSEEQKEMIKSMVEAGDVAGAQGLIIAELNKQVGGQAAAAAAADGGWTQFTATLGELEETVGAALLPALNELFSFLNTSVIPVVSDVVDAFGGVVEAFMDAGAGSSEFAESIGYLGEQLGIPADLIEDVIFKVQDIVKWFDEGGAASADLSSQVEDLNGIWTKAGEVVANVIDGYKAIINAVLPQIEKFIADHGEEIQAFFKKTWDTIIEIINLALDLYNAIVPPVLHAIADFINDHGSEIQKIFSGVWTAISSLISGTLDTIKGVIKLALDLIHGDWDAAWKDIQGIVDTQIKAIQGIVTGFLDTIAGIFDTDMASIISVWEGNWESIKTFVDNIDWAAVGQGVIDGVEAGINNAWSTFTSWVEGLFQSLLDSILKKYGISSPSKVFAESVGEPIVLGIMRGIENTWPDLVNQVGSLSASLVDDMEGIGQDIQNAIAGGFGATASIDRQMAKNLDDISKIQDEFQKKIVTQDLATLQKKANDLFTDPKTAADYYKMVSGHEFELLKIRQQIANVSTNGEKERADLMKQLDEAATEEERDLIKQKIADSVKLQNADQDRLNQQLVLISRAQDAEVDQFQAKQKGAVSPAQNIANEINDVIAALSKVKGLTDEQLRFIDSLAGVYQAFANPPSTSAHPAYTGQTSYNSTTNVNMPIYSNNSPDALQQSWAVMNAGMI